MQEFAFIGRRTGPRPWCQRYSKFASAALTCGNHKCALIRASFPRFRRRKIETDRAKGEKGERERERERAL